MPDFTKLTQSNRPAPDTSNPIVLALESSCDETAASVVCRNEDGTSCILSNIVLSQIEEHAAFGGVVPEIAARAHVEAIDGVIAAALKDADIKTQDLDAIAATAGPGLNGGLLVATMTGKAMAHALQLPFYPINHLEGHALTARLTDNVAFPYVLLLVSGGHTQILLVHGIGNYERIATTIDDALGEAFDKTAKMMGLDYPGGPAVERMARDGDETRFDFPRPMQHHETLNLSLSGLKTAVRLAAEKHAPLTDKDVSDICASFQQAVTEILKNRIARTLALFKERFPDHKTPTLVVAGGVAANQKIRSTLDALCEVEGFSLSAPPLKLCTDNAAMIATAAWWRLNSDGPSGLDLGAAPNLKLDWVS